MFEYKNLGDTAIDIIHSTFNRAFSDYQVKTELPLWKLDQMLCRRGYIPEKSIGAFKMDSLVGFILNGCRLWDGKLTAYDTGTGVIPEYRKQGLTTNMFYKAVELLKNAAVEQYLLEVIQSNTAAFELYKKQGFEITRTFSCYKMPKSKYKADITWKVEHVEMFNDTDWESLKQLWDVQPSWQNSIESLNTLPEAFDCSIVRSESSIIGYGIIERKTGDIPQIGVSREHRRKGIAASIISDLINRTESDNIAVINVDDRGDSLKNFLETSGFEHFIDQYEMILKI